MAARTRDEATKLLHTWQYADQPTNFTSQLFSLYQKADMENKARLRGAFPLEVMVFEEWYNSPNGDEWFREKGFIV